VAPNGLFFLCPESHHEAVEATSPAHVLDRHIKDLLLWKALGKPRRRDVGHQCVAAATELPPLRAIEYYWMMDLNTSKGMNIQYLLMLLV